MSVAHLTPKLELEEEGLNIFRKLNGVKKIVEGLNKSLFLTFVSYGTAPVTMIPL